MLVHSEGRRWRFTERVDAALFVFAGLAATWLAVQLLRQGVRPGWPTLLLLVFWLLFTYLLLPRLHRILTFLYVPGYFIGRTRTSNGLLGDPVNLGLRGTEDQIHQAMRAAHWIRADDLSFRTGLKIVTSTARRASYPEAPVSPLELFERQQDFAYQQEVAGSPSQRHHVRFWRSPEGWLLPGGFEVDWLAAGTYDRKVGLSLFTFQVTHKIEANIDIERDHIVQTVAANSQPVDVDVINNFSTGYHSRNGGGDLIETDGHLPIVDLRGLVVSETPREGRTDRLDRCPPPTVFAAAITFLRAFLYTVIAVQELMGGGALSSAAVGTERWAETPALLGLLLAALWEVGLGVSVVRGRNWARLVLMFTCVATTIGAIFGEVALTALPHVGSSILVLLALTSLRSRAYATRGVQG